MSRTRTTTTTLLCLATVLLAATVVPVPVQAEESAAGCVATEAVPHCVFTCPAYGVVKVAVFGPGEDGWIQGSIACGTPPGTSGYVKGMTISCRDDGAHNGGVFQDLYNLAWETVEAPLDDGECSAQMTNPGDGPLGQCWLVSGSRAVCSVTYESPLGDA